MAGLNSGEIVLTGSVVSIRAKYEDLTADEEQKLAMAIERMRTVCNHPRFRERIVGFFYDTPIYRGVWPFKKKVGVKRHSEYRWNKGKTNREVYHDLVSGRETLSADRDNEIDLAIRIDRRNKKKILGYTYPNTVWQWIYINFFKRGTVESISGNLFHEYWHKKGYGHEYRYGFLRQFTVPYAAGYIMRDFDLEA